MDESEHSDSGDAEERGVFGNLPRSRPGMRSPRRRESKEAAAASEAKPSPPSPRQRPAPAQPPPRAPEPEAPPRDTEGGGVEELAWAGITVAAEAATLGLRLLSRAVEAVRKPADRR